MTKPTLNGRQARWAESLAAFDFVLEYRTEKTNPVDRPSRRPNYSASILTAEEKVVEMPLRWRDVQDKPALIATLEQLRSDIQRIQQDPVN